MQKTDIGDIKKMRVTPVSTRKAALISTTAYPRRLHQERSHPAAPGSLALILDGNAHICFCSPALAQMVGTTPARLLGQPSKVLLQDLPLHPDTPGYNLAFAKFASQAGSRHACRLNSSGGTEQHRVEVALNPVKVNREHLLYLDLQWVPAPRISLAPTTRDPRFVIS